MTCSFSKKNQNHPPIFFDNVMLADVVNHKHLGLTFSHDLTWTSHIEQILKSVASMANVLKRLKYETDRKSLETSYFSFIRPKLEYASHIWDNCSKHNSALLESFQLDVARTVTGARKGTGHELLYNETGWPKLSERRAANKLKNLIKIANNETPVYLQNLLPPKIGDIRPMSRYADNYQLCNCRTQTFKNSFVPSAVKMWNDLPLHCRSKEYAAEISKSSGNPLFYEGHRNVNVRHAQLRMQCSKLNSHLFQLHVTESPACTCGAESEDISHFFLHCPLWTQQRQKLLQSLRPYINIDKKIDVNTLLYGNDALDAKPNKLIFNMVHTFISETDRL